MKFILPISVIVLTAACSTMPSKPTQPPPEVVTLQDAQTNIAKHQGKPVHWGGTIAVVRNLADGTQVEVVSRALDSDKRPIVADSSDGRFRVNFSEFLDPQVYSEGREVTITGAVSSLEHGKIGQYPYQYPLVAGEDIKLWQERTLDPHFDEHYHIDPLFFPYFRFRHGEMLFEPLHSHW